MIKQHKHTGRVFDFVNKQNVDEDQNIFTLIVGKNGTGKSRLLTAVVSEFIQTSTGKSIIGDQTAKTRTKSIVYERIPDKIISISASPFDKFPIPKRGNKLTGYSYLGLRDLSSQNLGFAYMSKIITSLLDAILKDNSQMNDIANVLNYLGFEGSIRARFQIQFSPHPLRQQISNSSTQKSEKLLLSNPVFLAAISGKKYFHNNDNKVDISKIKMLLPALRKISAHNFKNSFNIYISKNGIFNELSSILSDTDFLNLVHAGFIKLREVYLEKTGSNKAYSITDASSGEQSVVIGFLGIASQIQDNTLICIDEPEVCLHPEWQERYIRLLIDTFSRYKKFHFLIATHSPQIISKLESNNCFVLSMDDRIVTDAKSLINQSIDFQLANVFKSPGFRNEYLSRIALSIFSKVSVRKKFDDKDIENYNVLLSQENLLDGNDPVYDLVISIKKMHKIYAGNK